jgi:hypothetical protein
MLLTKESIGDGKPSPYENRKHIDYLDHLLEWDLFVGKPG